MFNKNYNNFVRPSSPEVSPSTSNHIARVTLSGSEVRELYLNEIKDPDPPIRHKAIKPDSRRRERQIRTVEISDKELLLAVQNDDVSTVKLALDACPDKVHKLDDYGWSLLMIACQANSVESVEELLKRGVDTSIRDKAGNSAQSLIIKNKNYTLADLILSNKSNQKDTKIHRKKKPDKKDEVESFFCDICNIKVSNKNYHLSSTIHNINLSKGKKIPTNYVIPESNKGYQIMLKVGWDKESGLGPDGSGKMYPIKTVQKQDRKGLGHGKRPQTDKEQTTVKHKLSKQVAIDGESNKRMEVNFRRQFY